MLGQATVNFLDDLHRQNGAVGLAREFVGAVRRAHGDRQSVDLGAGDEILGLRRIGQKLVMRELALGAVPVFLFAHAALERAKHAEFAFDGSADPMRHVDDIAGDAHIVVVVGGRLAVGLERAVHHHRGEAEADRAGAGRFGVAVVEMHDERNVRPDRGERLDHLGEHDVIGVGARAARGLDDDRRVDRRGRLHHREALLHIVDVERRNAVVVLGGVIEQLPQGDESHCRFLYSRFGRLRARAVASRVGWAYRITQLPEFA